MEILRLLSYFKRAYDGKKEWKDLKKKYHIDNSTQIIIMPDDDDELNKAAYKYMGYMLQRRNSNRVIIIRLQNVSEKKQDISGNNYEIIFCDVDKQFINNLLNYYVLHVFSFNTFIISYNKPNGNTMYKFIGQNGITAEDAVCLGMYCLREIPKGGEAL